MNCKVLIQSFIFFWIFSIAFLFVPHVVHASRSITIGVNKSVIFGYDEMTVTVASLSGFTNGETIYVKGAFYKDGTSNYFGYTKNGNNWIKNGDTTTNQKQITIGNWDGTITVKSDFEDSGYTGEGDYKFKVGFYYVTSGGNLSSVMWSTNSTDVVINDPDPTPTPASSPTSSTNTPTPTVKPTVTPTPTIKPTAIKSISLSPTLIATLSASISGSVLGSSVSPTLIAGISEKKSESINVLAISLVIGGILLLISCGILFFYKWKKGKTHSESDNE